MCSGSHSWPWSPSLPHPISPAPPQPYFINVCKKVCRCRLGTGVYGPTLQLSHWIKPVQLNLGYLRDTGPLPDFCASSLEFSSCPAYSNFKNALTFYLGKAYICLFLHLKSAETPLLTSSFCCLFFVFVKQTFWGCLYQHASVIEHRAFSTELPSDLKHLEEFRHFFPLL